MRPTIETHNRDLSLFSFQNMEFPNHLHAPIELLFPTRGAVWAHVDEKPVTVRPGEVLVIFPDLVHGYFVAEENAGFIAIVSPRLFPDLGVDYQAMRPSAPVVRLDGEDMRYCEKRLGEECAAKESRRETQIALLHLLMVHLLDNLRLKAAHSPPSTDMLYQAVAYISRYAADPLSVRSVAAALGINAFYLSHLLNDKLRMGFRAYLNTLRVDMACQMLLSTPLSVEEIGDRCGFQTLRTFDRVFGKIHGCTPSAFRKRTRRSLPPSKAESRRV